MHQIYFYIFVAFVLCYVSKLPVAKAMSQEGKGYDNRHPREQQARLQGWGKRAHAAHLNSFETFAPFAAAGVIAAQSVGKKSPELAWLGLVFIVARVAYVFFYLMDWHALRSLSFFVVLGVIGRLFFYGF